jgi:hypothetical protein
MNATNHIIMYQERKATQITELDKALLLEIIVRLAIVHVALVIFEFLHGFLLKDFVTPLLLKPFSHYIQLLAASSVLDSLHLRDKASAILVISWKCLVFGSPRARIPKACLDS